MNDHPPSNTGQTLGSKPKPRRKSQGMATTAARYHQDLIQGLTGEPRVVLAKHRGHAKPPAKAGDVPHSTQLSFAVAGLAFHLEWKVEDVKFDAMSDEDVATAHYKFLMATLRPLTDGRAGIETRVAALYWLLGDEDGPLSFTQCVIASGYGANPTDFRDLVLSHIGLEDALGDGVVGKPTWPETVFGKPLAEFKAAMRKYVAQAENWAESANDGGARNTQEHAA